jgi:hypothetical protein
MKAYYSMYGEEKRGKIGFERNFDMLSGKWCARLKME